MWGSWRLSPAIHKGWSRRGVVHRPSPRHPQAVHRGRLGYGRGHARTGPRGLSSPPMSIDPHQGQRIGRYHVISQLSVGGMAELFLGFTAGPGGFRKYVALKRILPDAAQDESFEQMFLDEARITAAFSHPQHRPGVRAGPRRGRLVPRHGVHRRAGPEPHRERVPQARPGAARGLHASRWCATCAWPCTTRTPSPRPVASPCPSSTATWPRRTSW